MRMRVGETQAKFVNGKPDRIEARYLMRSALEWDRFMRFMERYAEDQGMPSASFLLCSRFCNLSKIGPLWAALPVLSLGT